MKALSLCLAAALLVGCGDDPKTPTPSARGQVILPAGFALAATDLEVVSPLRSVSIDADGAFALSLLDAEPIDVELLDASGRLVMIGHMDDDGGEVSVRTTAIALLVEALGGFALPAENAATLRALVSELPELDALTDAVTTALIASPAALADGDPTLTDALLTARDAALTYDADIPVPRDGALVDAGADLLIQPDAGTLQSGATLLQNPSGQGLVVQNHFRRPAALLVYRVAEDDADGNKVEVAPPVAAGRLEVPPTGKLELFTAISNVVTGTAPFSPILSEPLQLALAASGKRAYYEAVLLGPTLDAVTRAPIWDDPRFASLTGEWNDVVNDKALELFFGEILGPILESYVFGRAGVMQTSKLRTFVERFKVLNDPHLAQLGVFLTRKSGYAEAVAFVLEEIATNATFRLDFVRTITDALAESEKSRVDFEAIEKKLAARASAATVLAAVQIALTSGDVAAIVKDLNDSVSAASWQVTTAPAVVRISPLTANVDESSSQVTFSATVRDAPGPLAYRWSTSGTYGYVNDYAHSGKTVDGTSAEALYQVENPTTIVEGQVDTVTVEVFARDESGGIAPGAQPIGRAVAQVTGKVRNLDARFFVQQGAMTGFRSGPVPCAVMFLRFPRQPGAKSYTISFEDYGSAGDRDVNNNAYLASGTYYELTVLAENDPLEEAWDGECYDTYGILAGFALSRQGTDYWLATYMAFQPLPGSDPSLQSLGERIELWYEWLDDTTVTVTPNF